VRVGKAAAADMDTKVEKLREQVLEKIPDAKIMVRPRVSAATDSIVYDVATGMFFIFSCTFHLKSSSHVNF